MKNFIKLFSLALLFSFLTSCSVATGIFKAGVGVGVFLVAIVVIIIILIVVRASKK